MKPFANFAPFCSNYCLPISNLNKVQAGLEFPEHLRRPHSRVAGADGPE